MLPLFVRLRERFSAWSAQWSQEVHTIERDPDDPHPSALSLCYLALLTSNMGSEQLSGFVKRLKISSLEATFLHNVARLRETIKDLESRAMLPSTLYNRLQPYSREARFVISVLSESALVRERLDLYERELASIKPRIDGHHLKAMGVPPGPIYREIIDRVRDALLDHRISTLEEETALASKLAQAAHCLSRSR